MIVVVQLRLMSVVYVMVLELFMNVVVKIFLVEGLFQMVATFQITIFI